MGHYPPSINRRSCAHRSTGSSAGSNAVGTGASFECGCFVRILLKIDNGSKTIKEASFRSNGCGYMIAAADKLSEVIVERGLTSLHSIEEGEFTALICDELGTFPAGRVHCLHSVLEAFRSALSDYRAYLIEEFYGEKALICTCFGITEESIEDYIVSKKPATVEEVTVACRAGGGCGSCRMLIQELLDLRENGI